MSSQTQKTFVQRVLHSNYIVQDHTVHEVCTLPGVTLLDMVYRLAPKYLGTQKIELRNVLFIQPIVTSEVFDKKVSVTFTPLNDHWKVNVSSQKVKGDTLLEEERVQNMECRLYLKETPSQHPKFDVQGFLNRAVRKYDMDDVYAFARAVKIHHDTFMKTLGTVYQSEQNEELMQLGLSGLAESYLTQFHAHVAFLDGSTFSGSSYTISHNAKGIFQDGTAYIPFMVQRICIYKAFPKTIYTYTKQNDVHVTKDLVTRNVVIYDESGDVLAELDQLTFKRIREPHLIRKLIEWTPDQAKQVPAEPVAPVAARPIPVASAPAVSQGDTLQTVVSYLQDEIAKELKKSADDISTQAGFYELGLDSGQLLGLVKVLEDKVQEPLYPTLLFEYSTVETLAEYVRENWANAFATPVQVEAPVAAAPQPQAQPTTPQKQYEDSLPAVIAYLQDEIGKELKKSADDISTQAGFYELGLDSGQLLGLVKVLEEKVKEPLYPTLLFEYSTVETLAQYVKENWESAFWSAAPAAQSAPTPPPQAVPATTTATAQVGKTLFFERVWNRQDVIESVTVPPARRHIIVFYDGSTALHSYVQAHTQAEVVVLQHANEANVVDQFETKLKQMVLLVQSHLKQKTQQECFIQIVADHRDNGRYVYALEGLLKTAVLESPKVHSQILAVEAIDALPHETWTALLEREARHFGKGTASVLYKGAQLDRYVHKLSEMDIPRTNLPSPYKQNGVYVITGGVGGLGLMVAHHMASQAKVRLALIGRSKLNAEREASIRELTKKGAQVLYLQADLAKESDTTRAFNAIRERWGAINGIHHCAGVVRDQFLVQKNPDTITEVVQPKLKGLWYLDQVTQQEPLDFLVLYSSISAVIGNMGQSDYASSNVFLDLFAEQRNELARAGKRQGRCVSVNWPLWADGGMQIDENSKQRLHSTTGLLPMPSAEGLQVLDASLQQSCPQVGVFYGDEALIRQIHSASIASATVERHERVTNPTAAPAQLMPGHNEDIAIIGVSGRYPMANSLEELYANLKAGKDCITGLPTDRWDQKDFPYQLEDLYQHGGFVDSIDEFDPIFFNISPYQAEMMDPQARLFLQSAWEACEDAGFQINRNKHDYPSTSNRSVGVFAGVFWNHYELYAAEMSQQGAPLSFGIGSAQIPNMVSYSLNLHGPSMAVDTMCSSSLTAIHLAAESIRRGECQFALAGGVNLVTHPHKYLFLKRAQFLSSHGRCRSFGKDGDGYVPGEGVGTLMLTSLAQAEKEGYPIYGVIKGSALNHVGKTSGPMVPDPVAQSEVIADAIKRANIDPRTISYIEAHGTGTSLGDPIELQGLEKAFKKWTSDKQYCAIGSLKSNIGHLEAAAGVAGITKLLLQMKHREIFPSLHSEETNPYLSFENSSFYLERQHREWKRPELVIDGKVTVVPRRAGISSFGANGSNAHLIIEEYIPQPAKLAASPSNATGAVLVPLSAKSAERLVLSATKLLEHLNGSESLHDVAYTLQVGREAMNSRVAFVVNSTQELIEKLTAFIEGKSGITHCFQAEVKDGKRTFGSFTNKDEMNEAIERFLQQKELLPLAELWVEGAPLDWNKLYGATQPSRVHLPTYPFANERYWVPQVDKTMASNLAGHSLIGLPGAAQLHPLLHRNTSDLYEQRFSTTLTGKEFFLNDHQINGRKVLPGVAYLEMARAAAAQAALGEDEDQSQVSIKLKHVAWSSPIHVDAEPIHVQIGLYPEANGEIAFEVYSEEAEVASQGRIALSQAVEAPRVDLSALQAACQQSEFAAAECYAAFQELGFAYGDAHQALVKVQVGDGQALAHLRLPAALEATQSEYTLHPSLLDAALQGTMLLNGSLPSKQKLRVPFALEELEVFAPCTSQMWAHVRYSAGSAAGGRVQKLDLDLVDGSGKLCVRLKGFSTRAFDAEAGSFDPQATLLFAPTWVEQSASTATTADYARHLVFLCEPSEGVAEQVASRLNGAELIALQAEATSLAERYQSYAVQVFEQLQSCIREKADGNILVQIATARGGEQRVFSGLAGLLQTAGLENPKIIGQVIEVEGAQLVESLTESKQTPADRLIRYADSKRWVAAWQEVETQAAQLLPWKADGVYLITGGAGGLGLVFAEEILSQVQKATLILTGRSPLSAEKREQLQALEAKGATIEYKQADVADKLAATELIQSITEQHGKLNGILHSAGVIQDNFILKKTSDEVTRVLAPKVSGVVHLDEASAALKLDFFVFFSSLAGAVGNAGQADYATANAFMDRYAEYRNALVAAEQRHGQTLSVNWPLWKDGGMQVNADTEQMMLRTMGIVPLETQIGMNLFYQGFTARPHQFVAVQGHLARVKELLGAKKAVPTAVAAPLQAEPVADSQLNEKAVQYLKKQLSSVLKLPANRIEAEVALENYGIDSVMVMQLTEQLETVFGSLSKTLFFEYQSIAELTEYFLKSHAEQLKEVLDLKPAPREASAPAPVAVELTPKKGRARGKRSRFATTGTAPAQQAAASQDVAIIGLSGRYPGAGNLNQFWENLKNGKNCITEIPEERWNHAQFYDERKNTVGKTYGKWGGFVDGVDQFDPLFFNISPREAEMMDPQERLFLESAYQAIEDAGYTREALNGVKQRDLTGNVGVFVGVMYEEYHLYAAQRKGQETPFSIGGHPASIANRVSYFFNFHGPSLAIDTMCSSSITAIHLACQSLYRNEAEVAIAGGVNVSVHPNKYLELAQGSFLSSKGLCESFGAGGDGYVPGEGVGAVLLKPLAKAIADGDHIYGIVKGSAINHGGKTNGYTVPNPVAQAAVIGKALEVAGVHPRTVSYIEAHGTGTSLGDPIEISGLARSFKAHTADNQFCAIGSVKSNIGHCESAAGISGLTKVLLQLKHRQLVPSIHSEVLNPNIDFSQTPFVVQQELTEWKRPTIEIDGHTQEYPRIAGISSFGAGGANAHLVIEEYIPTAEAATPSQVISPQNPAVIILSAKTEDRLQEQVKQLLTAMREESYTDAHLADIAFTLQVGREQMDERLGLIVESVSELTEKLTAYLAEPARAEDIYRGQIKRNKEMLSIFADDDDLQEAVGKWIERRKYSKLLELWVKGLYLDWSKLYTDRRASRMSLPTYPFARERYWVPQVEAAEPVAAPVVLHPLLHTNTSVLAEQRYSTTFTGEEFFLTDHQVQGRKVLPGAAYLEMARAAVEKAAGLPQDNLSGLTLHNIVWSSPIIVDAEPVDVQIGLYEEEQGDISFEIYQVNAAGERTVYSQGIAELSDETLEQPTVDLGALQGACHLDLLTAETCYAAFDSMGLEYGAAHRGIQMVLIGEGQALAKLALPSCIGETETDYVLHPALIDAALQSSIGLILGSDGVVSSAPALPFALEELEVYGACTAEMWAHVQYAEGSQAGAKVQKLHIDVCDLAGNVLVRMNGFTTRSLEKGTPDVTSGTLMLEPTWAAQSVEFATAEPSYSQHLVLLCEADDETFAQIGEQLGTATCIQLHAHESSIAARYQAYAAQTLEQLQAIIQSKPQGDVLIQVVTSHRGEQQLFAGLVGMLQTARLENPKLITQLIEWDVAQDASTRAAQLLENKRRPSDQQIRYEDGERWVAGWQEVEALPAMTSTWKDYGVYLITGGAGGLGLIFAQEIAQQVKQPVLILTGRSDLSAEKQAQLQELAALGAQVSYRRVDVAREADVRELMASISEEFGRLNGILHSAGITQDNFILRKTVGELKGVFAPKVAGVTYLDEASREFELDFFVFFSSLAGALGNAGQADYAAANAFLDRYAQYRNELVDENLRHGQTLSINWPLWKEGGMHVNAEVEKQMFHNLGLKLLRTGVGIASFHQALSLGASEVIIVEGDVPTLKATFGAVPAELELEADELFLQMVEKIANQELEIDQLIGSERGHRNE